MHSIDSKYIYKGAISCTCVVLLNFKFVRESWKSFPQKCKQYNFLNHDNNDTVDWSNGCRIFIFAITWLDYIKKKNIKIEQLF